MKVAPVIEDDIKLKIEGPAPVQARPTFRAGFIIICRLVFRIE